MDEAGDKLQAFLDERAKEIKLPDEAASAIELSVEISDWKAQIGKLETAEEILTAADLNVGRDLTDKAASMRETLKTMTAHLADKAAAAVEVLTGKTLVTFMSVLQSREHKDKFDPLIAALGDKEKRRVYTLLREQPLAQKDQTLAHFFEERIGYSMTTARETFLKESAESETAAIDDFLNRHVKRYTAKVKATIEWLKEDVLKMNLNDALYMRYGLSAVKRLEIGADIADQAQRETTQKELGKEFAGLIRQYIEIKKNKK